MTREEFARFLKKLKDVKEKGQDIDAFVKKYEHRNVYFYNDGCIKKILASEKNLTLTTDLVNAALGLIGSDRISIEVQHEDSYSLFKDRLVLYVARLTNNMVKQGEIMQLENLHVVSFQFFDAFAKSPNYRHTVQLKNQEQDVYFDKQTVTLVEVAKFIKNAKDYIGDNCRLAQWLRAIDALNREADFSEFANDPVFKLLQNEVKLCNFSSRYLMTVDMSDFDRAAARYGEKIDIAKKMLKQGKLSVSEISAVTGLPEAKIRDLK